LSFYVIDIDVVSLFANLFLLFLFLTTLVVLYRYTQLI